MNWFSVLCLFVYLNYGLFGTQFRKSQMIFVSIPFIINLQRKNRLNVVQRDKRKRYLKKVLFWLAIAQIQKHRGTIHITWYHYTPNIRTIYETFFYSIHIWFKILYMCIYRQVTHTHNNSTKNHWPGAIQIKHREKT